MCSQYAGVCVKNCRDEERAKQYSEQQSGCDARIVGFQFAIHEESIDQHGIKAQFHMFPGGFVYREEKTEQEVVAGPLVDKVRKRSGNDNKYGAYDCITF